MQPFGLGKTTWTQLCRSYFLSSASKASVHGAGSISSEEEASILALFDWFDSVGPNTTNSEISITLLDASMQRRIEECGMSTAALAQNDHSLWYEYNTLRNEARSQVHRESSTQRIMRVIALAQQLSFEFDRRGNLPR
jgi:hypothetical protein